MQQSQGEQARLDLLDPVRLICSNRFDWLLLLDDIALSCSKQVPCFWQPTIPELSLSAHPLCQDVGLIEMNEDLFSSTSTVTISISIPMNTTNYTWVMQFPGSLQE